MNKKNLLDRWAERFMELDSPVYGDERERAVLLQAGTFGMTLGIYVSLAAALIAALLGQLVLPIVLLLVMLLPTGATSWYAGRRGADFEAMAQRLAQRERAMIAALSSAALILISAAMLYTLYSGHGVIAVPEWDVTPTGTHEAFRTPISAGLIGGIGGALFGAVMMARKSRKTTPRPEENMDEDDL